MDQAHKMKRLSESVSNKSHETQDNHYLSKHDKMIMCL